MSKTHLSGPLFLGSYEPASTVALLGAGNTTDMEALASAANFIEFRLKSTATSGDVRGLYMRTYFNAAGAGETARFYSTVNAANVATGGTVNGMHTSLNIAASASVSGAGNAARFTLGIDADTRTVGGTLAVLELDSDIATGNTMGATAAFIRVAELGSVALGNLLNIPAASNGTIFATHTTQIMTHSIRIKNAAGTSYYIMVTDAATNRGGGS